MANLFPNPTMDVNITGYGSNPAFGAFLAAGFARDTVTVHAGAGSLKATWPAPSGSTRSWVNADAVTLTVGRRYHLSAWVYVPSGSPDVRWFAAFQGEGPICSVKDAWTELTWDFLANNGAAFFGIGTTGPPVSGQVMYSDDWYVDLKEDLTGDLDAEIPGPPTSTWIETLTGVLDAVLPGPITSSWFGRSLLRMVYTASGWVNLFRRKWSGEGP